MIIRFRVGEKVVSFDEDRMSFPEARWIKRETGFVGADFWEAARRLDPDAMLAIYALALRRDGMEIESLDAVPFDNPDNGYVELLESIVKDDVPENRATRRAKKT